MSYSVLAVGNGNIDRADHKKLATAYATAEDSDYPRAGIFPASDNPAGISNNSEMSAGINSFGAIVRTGGELGSYTVTVNETKFIEFDPGEAAVTRTDRIILRVYNDDFDGLGLFDARVEYLKGQSGGLPNALPDRSLLLWEIPVPAGASEGSGGVNFTAVAVDKRVYTTASGGLVPVTGSSAFPANAYDGQPVYAKDTNIVYVYDGTSFKPTSVPVASTTANLSTISNPYDGLLATTTDRGGLYVRKSGSWTLAGMPNMIKAYGATSSSDVTLTAVAQDITGASVTFTTTSATAYALIFATFDFDPTSFTASQLLLGTVDFGGTPLTEEVHQEITSVDSRATKTRAFPPLALGSAGSKTIKLRAYKGSSSNTIVAKASHSSITVIVFDI